MRGLTEQEVDEGLEHEWVGVGEAVERMQVGSCEAGTGMETEVGRFVGERDAWFVERFLEVVKGGKEGGGVMMSYWWFALCMC